TRHALERYAPNTEFVALGENTSAYWPMLCRLWSEREPFVLVEHDVEIHERTIRALTYCPQPWCVFPYPGPATTVSRRRAPCSTRRSAVPGSAPHSCARARRPSPASERMRSTFTVSATGAVSTGASPGRCGRAVTSRTFTGRRLTITTSTRWGAPAGGSTSNGRSLLPDAVRD